MDKQILYNEIRSHSNVDILIHATMWINFKAKHYAKYKMPDTNYMCLISFI